MNRELPDSLSTQSTTVGEGTFVKPCTRVYHNNTQLRNSTRTLERLSWRRLHRANLGSYSASSD